MKMILGRFILFLALVITSMSVCFPNDLDCIDEHAKTSKVEEKSAKSNQTEREESHHCVCSLSCHTMIVFTLEDSNSEVFSVFQLDNPLYSISHYPQVTLSLEKPPTV